MTAMAGMLLAGNAVFISLGIGTMVVVAVAIVGSVTVLPAVMARLGDRIEWGRVPFIAKRRARGPVTDVDLVVDRVLRRPVLSAVLATGLLLALAAPALTMRTVDPGAVGLPRSVPIMQTYDRIEAAFPGAPMSATVVVTANDVTVPSVSGGVAALSRAPSQPEAGRWAVRWWRRSAPTGPSPSSPSPSSEAGPTPDRPQRWRPFATRSSPAPSVRSRDVRTYVIGMTAASVDFNKTMKQHLPRVFVFVLGLAFLLLLLSFRSVTIPFMTIVLNLLSVGAAYGVTVLVFQDGNLRSLIGAQDVGGVIDWIPLFLLVVLFGLSMDYHVLILSRIREGHEHGLPTKRAVAEGITTTAGVITSAALVMIAVFAVFATLSEVDFKQLGVALASAVLIDATVVRIVLLPSVMTHLGPVELVPPPLARLSRPAPDSSCRACHSEGQSGRMSLGSVECPFADAGHRGYAADDSRVLSAERCWLRPE